MELAVVVDQCFLGAGWRCAGVAGRFYEASIDQTALRRFIGSHGPSSQSTQPRLPGKRGRQFKTPSGMTVTSAIRRDPKPHFCRLAPDIKDDHRADKLVRFSIRESENSQRAIGQSRLHNLLNHGPHRFGRVLRLRKMRELAHHSILRAGSICCCVRVCHTPKTRST